VVPHSPVTLDTTTKREVILARAIETFAAEGFRNADVQVIADKAGVGKGTVYRHFGNKEELFWAATYDVIQRLESHLFAVIDPIESSVEKLRAAGVAYAGFFEANSHYLEVFVAGRAEFHGSVPQSHKEYHEELIERFARILDDGIAAAEFRAVDVRKTITSLANILYGCVVSGCYSKEKYTLTDITRHTVEIFLDGIRTK